MRIIRSQCPDDLTSDIRGFGIADDELIVVLCHASWSVERNRHRHAKPFPEAFDQAEHQGRQTWPPRAVRRAPLQDVPPRGVL